MTTVTDQRTVASDRPTHWPINGPTNQLTEKSLTESRSTLLEKMCKKEYLLLVYRKGVTALVKIQFSWFKHLTMPLNVCVCLAMLLLRTAVVNVIINHKRAKVWIFTKDDVDVVLRLRKNLQKTIKYWIGVGNKSHLWKFLPFNVL